MDTNPTNEIHAMPGLLGALNRIQSFIRHLSAPAEFCLILFVGFGPFIFAQLWALTNLPPAPMELRNSGLVEWLILEPLLFVPVLWIGKLRGWSLATFGARISWKGTGAGILLFVLAAVTEIAVSFCAKLLHPAQPGFSVGELAVPLVLLLSFINPIFEETLENAYFIRSLQRFGMWPAVLASALFRGLFHFQFGINAVVSVSAIGVIFGLAYWRGRQLWPLVLAHSLLDIVALLHRH
jgi:membrane protease YdiL (CAAX protease family)